MLPTIINLEAEPAAGVPVLGAADSIALAQDMGIEVVGEIHARPDPVYGHTFRLDQKTLNRIAAIAHGCPG